MLIAGLDEAGRGPVIGSMVIGCVVLEQKDLPILEELGVDDSKKLSPKKREFLDTQIRKHALMAETIEITAQQINILHNKGLTLNEIEEMFYAQLLNSLDPKPDIIYLDAADVYEERFGQSIAKLLKFKPKKIISKHKGDALFPIVGAGSIIAKTLRDRRINEYKIKFGEIGSGYPSDPKTKLFLKEYYAKHQKFPEIVRTWWKTAENIIKNYNNSRGQKKLTDF